MGVLLQELSVHSTNAEWQRAFTAHSDPVFKVTASRGSAHGLASASLARAWQMCTVKNFALYLQPDAEAYGDDVSRCAELLRGMAETKQASEPGGADAALPRSPARAQEAGLLRVCVVQPLSPTLRLCVHKREAVQPSMSASAEVGPLALALDEVRAAAAAPSAACAPASPADGGCARLASMRRGRRSSARWWRCWRARSGCKRRAPSWWTACWSASAMHGALAALAARPRAAAPLTARAASAGWPTCAQSTRICTSRRWSVRATGWPLACPQTSCVAFESWRTTRS